MEGSFSDYVFAIAMLTLCAIGFYGVTRDPVGLFSSDWKCTEYMETEKTCVKYEMVVKK